MNESRWICERCGREFDLENGDGGVTLVDEEISSQDGKLTPLVPYEKVCYECADELLSLVEKCNKECWNCEVTVLWGLSVMDCLKLQLKFELLDLPQRKPPRRGGLEEAKEILTLFNRF